MDIKRIKELDCLAHAKKTKIEELRREIESLKSQYAHIYAAEAELREKIKKIEQEIEDIKAEIDVLYGQEKEPIVGALHYFRYIQQFEVSNINKVPLDYKTVDMNAVKNAFKCGIKVPGIAIVSKRIISLK